jgi:hypothetical protein
MLTFLEIADSAWRLCAKAVLLDQIPPIVRQLTL